MSEQYFIVSNGEKICAIPISICEQYKLNGSELDEAKKAIEETDDVVGQGEGFYPRLKITQEEFRRLREQSKGGARVIPQ